MRTLSLVASGCAIATLFWLIPHGATQVVEPDEPGASESYALTKLFPDADYPVEPLFMVVTPVPATLTDGVPPT